jgi:hypothetical protein
MIAHLYEVEKLARRNGLRGELLRVAREQDAHPMLDGLHAYLLAIREQVLPEERSGTSHCLHAQELDGADSLLLRRRSAHRQQCHRTLVAQLRKGEFIVHVIFKCLKT